MTTEHRVDSVAILLAEALVRRTEGHALHLADDVLRRTMGFEDVTTGERFDISLTDVKKTSQELSERARELLQSVEGRQQLMATEPSGDDLPVVYTAELSLVDVSDACCLIEQEDDRACGIEVHPDDLERILTGTCIQPGDQEAVLESMKLWGMDVTTSSLLPRGRVLLTGEHGKQVVIVETRPE